MRQLVDRFERALLAVDRLEAAQIFMEWKDDAFPIRWLEQLVLPTLERIGEGWEQGRVALSQVYMSARICEELVDNILPPDGPGRQNEHKIAIAVLEDYHLLGKRIVYSVLRASGYEVIDYGRVELDDLVRRVENDGIRVLLVSTLMLPSALRIKELRVRLGAAGTGDNVSIVVGGAPFRFDHQLWQEVGADAMGRNASEVVDIINRITGGKP